jgi:hypothetical protein
MGQKITHYLSVLQNHIICNSFIPFKDHQIENNIFVSALNSHITARAPIPGKDVCHLQLVIYNLASSILLVMEYL